MRLEEFKNLPIMGILRGVDPSIIGPLTEAVVLSGLGTIEVTMNTPSASVAIKEMVKAAKGRLVVGAGTVLSLDDLKLALDSGATFVVSPTVVDEVLEYCVKEKIPVFPGALTPGEISNAWGKGATMVKVFPAKVFGPDYFKEIKGPFADIELMACGGVNVDNIAEFFAYGASAVAFGASIFKKQWLLNKDFALIEQKIRKLIKAYNEK